MSAEENIWEDDLLGFEARGDAFTKLISSMTDHRTISIEAGYGHGKTFFRKRWAKQLEAAGECVVQIDARLSDHSGDAVVTFLGALLAMVPEKEKAKRQKVFAAGKKIAVASGKALGRAALREGFNEIADLTASEDGAESTLNNIAEAAGQELSKAAGDLIAKQLSAEKARKELGEQLKALHAEITKGRKTDRIVILIDELDRCHPDYAIALLETMKLVFDQDGFVFVLMVNREYLEKIAAHRFGKLKNGELYLDKFVDLRLKLEADEARLVTAISERVLRLPLEVPFSEHQEFSLQRAAEVTSHIVKAHPISMRQILRTLERIELVCRLYGSKPIDLPLLLWLAFDSMVGALLPSLSSEILPRSKLSESFAWEKLESISDLDTFERREKREGQLDFEIQKSFPELFSLTEAECGAPQDGRNYYTWAKIYKYLAPHYIPDHQAMLDAVYQLQADP